ncbi:MAG TPA: hypothetical protein VFZ65_08075 [Planctomycetota bacterium]|nr:hypothetical protein [Planctomycetota bacterium]
MHAQASGSLAHATIPVSAGMVHLAQSRLDIFLRETAGGRFRWFHADGSPTVIDGESPKQAVDVARLVWRDMCLLEAEAVPHA